jgi:hypothetical protein
MRKVLFIIVMSQRPFSGCKPCEKQAGLNGLQNNNKLNGARMAYVRVTGAATQNSEHRTPNTELRTQNSEHRTPNKTNKI